MCTQEFDSHDFIKKEECGGKVNLYCTQCPHKIWVTFNQFDEYLENKYPEIKYKRLLIRQEEQRQRQEEQKRSLILQEEQRQEEQKRLLIFQEEEQKRLLIFQEEEQRKVSIESVSVSSIFTKIQESKEQLISPKQEDVLSLEKQSINNFIDKRSFNYKLLPLISLFGSANRPHLWLKFYESLAENKIPFEIIFVGDKTPDFKLPPNFYFIYSKVKPVQCMQIAINFSNGEYLVPVNDDFIFSYRALDCIFLESRFNNEYDIHHMIYSNYNGERYSLNQLCLFPQKSWEPVTRIPRCCVAGLINKKLISILGGLDNRFIGAYAVEDLTLRAWFLGGKIYESQYASFKEIQPCSLWGSTDDLPFLYSLWIQPNNEIKRDTAIFNFLNNQILFKTQGRTQSKWND